MCLRVYFDSKSNPLKKINLKIKVNLHSIKQCKLTIYALFYCINTIQVKNNLHFVLQCYLL